jgi:hypothetical protein
MHGKQEARRGGKAAAFPGRASLHLHPIKVLVVPASGKRERLGIRHAHRHCRLGDPPHRRKGIPAPRQKDQYIGIESNNVSKSQSIQSYF